MVFKIDREFVSVPTLDTERKSPFTTSVDWTPSNINIFGHSINIDIPTGNLLISTTDVTYPYYNFSLGITRKYDLQEQYMQLTYLRNYPNVNPKPHWFGNWQFAYEADIDEVWRTTLPELHITSGVGTNGLFEEDRSEFLVHQKNQAGLENILLTHGIPKKTLNELGWHYSSNDLLLRTSLNTFQIATGFFHSETLINDTDAKIWLFNPITGTAFYLSSDYFYNENQNQYHDVGYPLLVTKIIDCLGHKLTLRPTQVDPPYREYELFDDSTLPNPLERKFVIKLEEELTYIDGLENSRLCRKNIVSQVIDKTKTNHGTFDYQYHLHHYGSSDFKFLKDVFFPCSIAGNPRKITYHYDNPKYPGVLSAIGNTDGDKIVFEYLEDPTDNDDRLNPRLKIHKIIDPEGITFEYTYNTLSEEVNVTVSQNGRIDKTTRFQYFRDLENTKKRYIIINETKVTRGYVEDAGGNIIERDPTDPTTVQVVKYETKYSTDGRFNIIEKIYPIHGKTHGVLTYNRIQRFSYNDFNQIKQSYNFDGKWTKFTYDIPELPPPSNSNPIRYDLLLEEKQNHLRQMTNLSPLTFVEQPDSIVSRSFKYKKYDVNTSPEVVDHELSTHRLIEMIDERGRKWTHSYDDLYDETGVLIGGDPNKQFSPSLNTSPLSYETKAIYNDRGNILTKLDVEMNKTTYAYTSQGQIDRVTDPNGEIIALRYYPCGNWILEYEDQLHKVTSFTRHVDGLITRITDPVGDSIEYQYLKNQRFWKIINHRPLIRSDPADPASAPLIIAYPNLVTEFVYTPLGNVESVKNPLNLEIIINYDEIGRKTHVYNNHNNKKTKYVYDEAGQLIYKQDRNNKITKYTYSNIGFINSTEFPSWNDGVNPNPIPGKNINFLRYNYFGQIITKTDSDLGTTEYTYDESGNTTFRKDPNNFMLIFHYDDDDRLDNIKDAKNQYILDLRLDSLGRIDILEDSNFMDNPIIWDYNHNKTVAGVKKVLNLFKIKSSAPHEFLTEFDYDNKNRLISLDHKWINPNSPIFSQTFIYRSDDSLKEILGDHSNSYKFDGMKQIIYEAYGNTSTDYDEAGNRLYNIDKVANPGYQTAVHNNQNQLVNERNKTITLTYDDVGNMQTLHTPTRDQQFYFDGANKLRYSINNDYKIKYVYDGENRLVRRITEKIVDGSTDTIDINYLFTKPIVYFKNGMLDPYLVLTWDNNDKLLRIRKENSGSGDYPHSLFPVYNSLGDIIKIVNSDRIELICILM